MKTTPKYKRASVEAKKLIREMGIDHPPIIPTEIASELGLSVYEIDMPKGFENVAGFIDFDNQEIIVNKGDSSRRKSFSIAHEIGHYILHKEEIENNPSIYKVLMRRQNLERKDLFEQEANHFAACLLTPKELLVKYRDIPLQLQAAIFGVSPQLLKYRPK
jgi:Zn-dependent peptidase ImmA (M78 family)